jgi:hypothetical protein
MEAGEAESEELLHWEFGLGLCLLQSFVVGFCVVSFAFAFAFGRLGFPLLVLGGDLGKWTGEIFCGNFMRSAYLTDWHRGVRTAEKLPRSLYTGETVTDRYASKY